MQDATLQLIWIENGQNIARNNCLQISKLPLLEFTDEWKLCQVSLFLSTADEGHSTEWKLRFSIISSLCVSIHSWWRPQYWVKSSIFYYFKSVSFYSWWRPQCWLKAQVFCYLKSLHALQPFFWLFQFSSFYIALVRELVKIKIFITDFIIVMSVRPAAYCTLCVSWSM